MFPAFRLRFLCVARHLLQVPNKLPILSAATRAADFIGHQDVNQFENGMQYRWLHRISCSCWSVPPEISNCKSKHDSIILWWFWCRTSLWYQWYLYLTFNWSKVTFCHRFKRLIPVLETCWALGVRPAQMHSAILVPTSCALKQFRASRLVLPPAFSITLVSIKPIRVKSIKLAIITLLHATCPFKLASINFIFIKLISIQL